MIILVRADTPREEVERLRAMLLTSGCEIRETESTGFRMLCAERHWEQPPLDLISQLKASEFVFQVFHPAAAYPIVSSDRKMRSVVKVGDAAFGSGELQFIAGPCTVESEELLLETALAVKASGAKLLRGGAYKPTTSPYSFGGHGDSALAALKSVREKTGLGIVTEVMDQRKVERVSDVADMFQVGARSMQNFDLLRELGRQRKPILLKRGMSARIEEWLSAAEYIAREGNESIILCERGIRTFEGATRATLDVSAIAVIRTISHLPVLVDPSHAAGNRLFVSALALAAVAAGADGLLIEVHPRPEQAIKDGAQTISTRAFDELANTARRVAEAIKQRDYAAASVENK